MERGHVRWLRAELAALVRDGVLDEAAAARLRARYPEPLAALRLQHLLAVLGAVLVGVGVILFFAANWEAIPRFVRAGAVLAAIGAAYGAAWRLRWRPGLHPQLGEALLLLGGIFFGAGIWLIAQIFHISDHQPNGALLWGLGVLPLAWATRSHSLTVLSLATLTLYACWETSDTERASWLWAVAYAPAAAMAYAVRSRAAVAAALVGALVGAAVQLVPLLDEAALVVFPALGALVWLGAALHESAAAGHWREHAAAWRLLGALAALGGMAVLTFGDVVREVAGASGAGPSAAQRWGAAALVVGGGAAVGAVAWWRGRRAEAGAGVVLAVWLAATALVVGPRAVVAVTVTNNLMLVALVCALVAVAVRRGFAAVQYAALAAFAVQVLSRYFDLFFDLMPRSAFFLGVGLLLLGGVYVAARLRLRQPGGPVVA
ncbi:MAG TPA: DUF2157 domain-containing protein [Myxococcota bacterium]|jgi:uncharacterized membrane protein|nr:DUF2157 domain-containing protein [Myxococcota bacterium]